MCDGIGLMTVNSCPYRAVPATTWALITDLDWAMDQGAWPVGGGLLDQSAAFVQACEAWRVACNRWKAKLGIRGA